MASRFTYLDWFLSVDPALSRTRMGARVTLGIALSIAALAAIHQFVMPLPPIAYGLAMILSIQGGVSVRDQTPHGQLVTRLLGGGASLCSILLASLLEENRLLSDLAFLCIVFAASFARVFGPRGFAVGMFAFTSYFMAAYLKPDYQQLLPAALALFVAIAIGHLVRAVLLPDDRGRDLLHALIALQARVYDLLIHLAVLARTQVTTDEDRTELGELQERIKDIALMAEGFLPRDAHGAIEVTDQAVADVAMAIFDLHLAAESVVVLSLYNPPPFGLVHGVIEGDEPALSEWHGRAESVPDKHRLECIHAFEAMHGARKRMDEIIRSGSGDNFHALAEQASRNTTASLPDISFSNPFLRAAIQITIASGVAMMFGLWLSRDRWFWAVLTAFLVFNNTKSRGDTAIRALQRSIGTVLGIAVGLGLASLLQGNIPFSVAIAGLGIFLGFYALQASYAVMTFFVSIVLCVIYGLIGTLTLDLLRLRIEETLIGAVAGIAVAFVVFPSKTRETLHAALDAWYGKLEELLNAALSDASTLELIEISRQLDQAYSDLAQAARPLGTSWSIVTKPGHVRQTLAIYLASTYWARVYARGHGTSGVSAEEEASAIRNLHRQIASLRTHGPEPFYRGAVTKQSLDYLPNRALGYRHGLSMIGAMLNRLKP
ncbi:FUSC family protein [Rhizobium helianthi]|uniref:FUSC family protein n=1 Tax=Rhizobium helianthi TaxID=1132695 RepID=A0ABW4M099_9HYPH